MIYNDNDFAATNFPSPINLLLSYYVALKSEKDFLHRAALRLLGAIHVKPPPGLSVTAVSK
jgi:hypothetical protein